MRKREPVDLLPAYAAAKFVCANSRTLKRWAAEGRITEYKREGYKARFYSRTELEKFVPKAVEK